MVACSGLRKSLRLQVAVLAALCAKAVGLVMPRSEANRALPSSSESTFSQVACEATSLPLSVPLSEMNGIVTNANCPDIQNKSAQRYIVLGGFDSGTNLLHQMMFRSWPDSVCRVDPMWKHAATGVEDIYNYLSSRLGAESLGNTVILHTLRSPVSQLASWVKAPYEIEPCTDRSVTDWIHPCYATVGPDGDNHPYEKATRFPSTMAVYIQYIKQLKELHRHGGFKAVVGVHFEDMILTPGKTMKHIAKHFDGVVVPQNLTAAMEDPAKDHGACLGYKESLEKLHTRSYLSCFGDEDLKIICDGLNKTLLEGHIEGSFLKPDQQVPYWQDCRGRSSE